MRITVAIGLGLALAANGLLMLLDPAGWYALAPGVPETGPLNLHFVRDIGCAYILTGLAPCRTRFAKASLAHDAAADELRDEIVKRWGPRGLISLAFALVCPRVYPTVKYALGHGKACTRLTVAGKPLPVLKEAA
jgi:hypothetical protein